MMCKNPYMGGPVPVGCGQCTFCRINRRRLWAHRIELEARKHAASSFVTLTYSDENLPKGGTLVPRDTQLFLKRLRKRADPVRLRYFFVGEYGDQTQRPHYHVAIFGLGIEHAQLVAESWPYGHTMTAELNEHTSQYIAGYVIKKMTKADDERLGGRHPEFARMSLKPAIGGAAMQDIADILTSKHGSKVVSVYGDVPNSISYGQRERPIGRTLRSILRESIGGSRDAPESVKTAYQEQVRDMWRASLDAGSLSFKEFLLNENEAKRLKAEARFKIFNQRKTL